MENGYIKDHQLTASSVVSISDPLCCLPARARFGISATNLEDSWVPGSKDTAPWLRVDFIANTSVSGIMTQGGRNRGTEGWINNYTVSYSTDGEMFQYYSENDATKVKIIKRIFALEQDKLELELEIRVRIRDKLNKINFLLIT